LTVSNAAQTADDLSIWLRTCVAGLIDVDITGVDPDTSFAELGLSSLQAVELSGELEDHLQTTLSPMLAYDYPTIRALAQHLADESAALA
jgi:acyl carrier protein